jgi:hypothetical protein
MTLSAAFVRGIVSAHKFTLTRLALDNCTFPDMKILRSLCVACKELAWLRLGISGADIDRLAETLSPSQSLRTLVDTGLGDHGHIRFTLVTDDARTLLEEIPGLQIFESGTRRWVIDGMRSEAFTIRLEAVNTDSAIRTHWFIPGSSWQHI